MKSKAHKSRKRRSRRPKFLSLRRQLSATDNQRNPPPPPTNQESDVAELFAGPDRSAATLAEILPAKKEEETVAEPPRTAINDKEEDGCLLERAALRRWREEEDMSGFVKEEEMGRRRKEGLALKLDYEEVVEAWCGGTPFFLGDHDQWEGPHSHTVPDLGFNHHFFSYHDLNPSNEALWGVPDQKSFIHNGKDENGEQAMDGWRVGQREASLLRYKEKRMNRLFSKRIRYQVRKLNAEKRPRVKGRFVKRS